MQVRTFVHSRTVRPDSPAYVQRTSIACRSHSAPPTRGRIMMRKSILMVLPLAPWPARQSGVSIRYYPIIEHLASRYTVDIFVHGELRSQVPEDPLLESLDRC